MVRMQFEEAVPHPPGTNDFRFHRKQFLAERVGWVAMALCLAWALLGGFGEGWISRQQASNDAQSCTVEYERFGRRDAPFELRVRLQLDAPRDRISLHLNREFLERVSIERVTPAYASMAAEDQGAALVFTLEPKPGDHIFTIEYRPQHIGSLPALVRVEQEAAVAFDQFIYP
jgi:hypothetical protein